MATLSIKSSENSMANILLEYSRQIWLAGLGALSRAESEGSKLFETLVKEGEKAEARSKKAAEEKAARVQELAQKQAEELGDKASGTWNKLEQVFQDRVARALNRLGVPSHEDVRLLSKQVEALNASIDDLIKSRQEKPQVNVEQARAPSTEVRKSAPVSVSH
jgi:poly(hydroxyalkanoate) granule-associated protein